jgi:protein tyrosine/serine phosphatase
MGMRFQILVLLIALGGTSVFAADDLPNFKSVNDFIFRGGRPTAAGLSHLHDYGVKTDIDLQGGDLNLSDPLLVNFMKWWEPGETEKAIAQEKQNAESAHLNFVNLPLSSLIPVTEVEDLLVDQVIDLMADKSAQPVFVHCEHGWDRTGLVVALYRVKFEGWSADDAHAEWVANGHSGVGAYFTGNLDKYFYKKVAKIAAARAVAER